MLNDPGEELRQGDIVESLYFPQLEDDFPAICITPICDLTLQEDKKKGKIIIKANYVAFCMMTYDVEFFKEQKDIKKELQGETFETISNNKKKAAKNFIINFMTGRNQRYFWIYDRRNKKGFIVDYQVIHSIKFSEAEKLKVIGSLKSSYKEQVATRYAAYMGRIGVEDLSYEKISEKMLKTIIEIVNI